MKTNQQQDGYLDLTDDEPEQEQPKQEVRSYSMFEPEFWQFDIGALDFGF